MTITDEIVAAFVKCETKSYLKHCGVLGAQAEVSQLRQHQRSEYRESCRQLLCSAASTAAFVGTPDLPSLKGCRYELVVDYEVAQGEIPAPAPAPQTKQQAQSNELMLDAAIDRYLENVATKCSKTSTGYRYTLQQFYASAGNLVLSQ